MHVDFTIPIIKQQKLNESSIYKEVILIFELVYYIQTSDYVIVSMTVVVHL